MTPVKTLHFLLIVLFLTSLLIPAIYTQWNTENNTSQTEKREMSAFPPAPWKIDNSLYQWTRWPRNIEQFFNDKVGLRAKCIHTYNSFTYYVLNYSAVRHVIKGENGWLFFNPRAKKDWKRGEDSIADARSAKPLPANKVKKWITKLKQNQAIVESWGGHFTFAIAPNKSTVYPEYLPFAYRKRTGKGCPVDQIITAARKANIDVIDLRNVISAESDKTLYFKRDTHWNDTGAFIATKYIMQHLHQYNSNIPIPKISDFNIKFEKPAPRDLGIMTGIKRLATSQANEYIPVKQHFYNEQSLSPTIVMYHDSFGIAVKRLIDPYTPNLTTYIYSAFGTGNIKETKPDFVIQLIIERYLRN